jgi:hypothetical protein
MAECRSASSTLVREFIVIYRSTLISLTSNFHFDERCELDDSWGLLFSCSERKTSERELDEPEDGCSVGEKVDEEECVYEPASSASAVKNCCQLHFCELMLFRRVESGTLLEKPKGLETLDGKQCLTCSRSFRFPFLSLFWKS